MDSLQALLLVFVVFTIGDIVATATKSIVPSLFVCSAIFLVGFWMGVPVTLFQDSLLYSMGALFIAILLVHMGSMLNLQQLKEQWKTLVIGVGGILGIVILLLTVGRFIVGFETAIVAAPPISGGVIAGLQMAEAAKNIGRTDLQLMATLLVVLQGFIGYPLASFCLRKEAANILRLKAEGHVFKAKQETVELKKRTIFQLPEKYASSNYYLAKTVLVALLATLLSSFLKGIDTGIPYLNTIIGIDKNIIALLLGIVFAEIGVLEREPLNKGNSFGLVMACIMAVIYGGLAGATPNDLINIIGPLLICLALGTIGIAILSIIVGKFVKVSPWMAFAIGSAALFGFPGTFIVSKEVANAMGKDESEKEIILSQILPKMLVAGFVTVSIGSVILAGFLVPLITPAL